MAPWAVVLLGLGLAVDSTLVALALGLRAGASRRRVAVAIGAAFGLVHGALTVLGWALGANVAGWFERFDHWIAFAVLAGLGLKSLLEARDESEKPARELSVLAVLAAAVATSLDGVAVGFGLALAQAPVGWIALSATGATMLGVTASFSLGRRIPARWQRIAQVGAGLLLIAIGASILHDHLS